MIVGTAVVGDFLHVGITVMFIEPGVTGWDIASVKSGIPEIVVGTGDEFLADPEPAVSFGYEQAGNPGTKIRQRIIVLISFMPSDIPQFPEHEHW